MHPRLLLTTAHELAHKAAVGLGRHAHQPGVRLATRFDLEERAAELYWLSALAEDEQQLDRIRVTEDAAEAIALAFVHGVRGWTIDRRLQRGEVADWLLQDTEGRLVALEVSGVGAGRDPQRLAEKLEQVRRAPLGDERVACVVELEEPRTTARTA
jgi:hypothetical protein